MALEGGSGVDAIDVIAAFADERPANALGAEDLDRMTLLVLDGLGCLFGGSQEDVVRETFGRTGTDGVRLGGEGGGRWTRSFIHGVALRYLDYLDTYSSKDTCHPSEHLPVALGIAEATGATGRDLLEALAVGYEVQCRLADAIDLRHGGMHHATAAAVTVPVMAARLGAVPKDRVRDAVALAVSSGVVLRSISQGALSMAKAFAFPLAARRALDCMHLAARGVTGPRQALDDLLDRAGGSGNVLAEVFDDSSSSAHVAAVQLKTYPVQYALQAIVECGVLLHPVFRAGRDRIVAVRVIASNEVLRNTTDHAKRHPATREAADHSLFACLGMAIARGDVGVTDFRERAWLDDDVQRIADMIRWEVAEPGGPAGAAHAIGARVEVHLADGSAQVAAIEAPLGSAERPMTEAQVVAKFLRNSAAALGNDNARSMVRTVMGLATRQTVTADVFAGPGQVG